jgi:hypothetical protein
MDWFPGLGVLLQGWWVDRCWENKIKRVVYSTSKIKTNEKKTLFNSVVVQVIEVTTFNGAGYCLT